ncbi:MAG: GDSL-type esterase/lipase family protein [Myxococcota bacterium]|nr:GDSL-type esterase/lipase family protein [Myxococcota bacterium]
MSGRPEQPEPFLCGCAWPGSAESPYPRCDPGPNGMRLPADTRAAAALPVGVRFEFLGEPESLEIEYSTETDEVGYRGAGAGTQFVLFRGSPPGASADAQLGPGRVRLRVGQGTEAATLYLPEGMRPTVLALKPQGGQIRPLPPRPRWLCYGDSIAEGWCASEPSAAWPHDVARQQGLDVVNLSYAGAARGEVASAEEIASLAGDLISIAHGTNCWTRTPHSEELFAASLRAFIDVVRTVHSETPIVAISPILRPDAESTPNLLGASLGDLRNVFESVIEERQKAGDSKLILVKGMNLVREDLLPDGIHPGDAGHADMARTLGPILAEAVNQGDANE